MPWPTTPLFSYFLVRAYIQTGVKNGRSKGVRSVLSGEQSCQVAALDLAMAFSGIAETKWISSGTFEVGPMNLTVHLELLSVGGTSL
jgi:hypothetical protein